MLFLAQPMLASWVTSAMHIACIANFFVNTLPSQLSHFSCILVQVGSSAQLWFSELAV